MRSLRHSQRCHALHPTPQDPYRPCVGPTVHQTCVLAGAPPAFLVDVPRVLLHSDRPSQHPLHRPQ